MKKNLFIILVLSLIFNACKKGDTGQSGNTWTFGGTKYTAAQVVYISAGSQSNLSATATGATQTSNNSLVFTFSPPPTASSQMLISNSGAPNTVMISVMRLAGQTVTIYTNDIPTVNSKITVANSKVSATFSGEIMLHNANNYNDSLRLSVGTITQN